MKNLIIISLLLLVGLNGFGKTGFLIDTSQVQFKLKVEPIKEINSDKMLSNVRIKIVGSDSIVREFISDSLGVFPLIELKKNTSYSTLVFKEGYYTMKGKETSIGQTSSKLFVHEYELAPLIIIECFPLIPEISYDKNGITPTNTEDVFHPLNYIMNENPNVVVQIIGYRRKSEKENISNKRVQYFANKLISLGVDKQRLKIIDGGYIENTKIQNKYLTAQIINADYTPKK